MDSVDRVLKAVERSSADLTRFLRDLVRAESITGFEGPAQEVVRDRLKSMGARVDVWRPSRKDFAGYEAFVAEEVEVGKRPNLVGRFGGSEGRRTLAFNGHIDVVPEGDPGSWKHPPYAARVEGGKLYGRGACDMKAGLAATVFAVQALQDAGVTMKGDILIESVIGEESSGMGTLASILRGYRPDAAIIAEPTSLKLVTVQAGCLNFRIRVRGKAAHGASRYLGVSAIEKFLPVHEALLALEEERRLAGSHPLFEGVPNPVPLSIGKLRAGDWDSTVPAELVAEGRCGVWPGEKLAQTKRQFEAAVSRAARADPWLRENPPEVTWFGPQWEPAEIPGDHWLAKLLDSSCVRALGRRPARAGITAGTDMRLYTNVAGCPAVVFGPGDDSIAHFSDEYVELDEVVQACKVYATAALSWNE
jgi:acetylornithine deacetylase